MYNNYYSELYHFGIKGMQWGKRRYQNEDGSLTPEGYIHYGRKKRRLERSIDNSKKVNQHIDYAQKFGRQQTAYQWETSKAVVPITALGAAIFEGGATAAMGAEAADIALASIGGLAVGGPGLLALTGLTVLGSQVVNKLLMYEHGKREKRVARQKQQINDINKIRHQHGKVSAQKKAIDSKLSQYEASSKKKKLNHSELYHFGILGQKWGVRRYQNKDGSLTPEGYEHYGYRKNNSKKVQKLVNNYIRKNAKYTTEKRYGYKSNEASYMPPSEITFNSIDESKKYTDEQKQKALDNMFSKAINDKANVDAITEDIKSIYGEKASYNKNKHHGINIRQRSDEKWRVESYYTPDDPNDNYRDDQPWYSIFETDNPFNPSYFKYKGGGWI